jgi:Uma2 family endonuclease
MSDPVKQKRKATYDDILKLPDNMIGEIVDGELYISPRPHPKHALAISSLCEELIGPFSKGKRGGPGGWIILADPEVHLGGDNEVFVPDIGGWKKERLPTLPEEAHITVVPNWVCEILSPSNARLDRVKKVPKYASFGVEYLWLINPRDKTLEAFRLENAKWVLLSTHADTDKIRVPPFEAMEFDLGELWE